MLSHLSSHSRSGMHINRTHTVPAGLEPVRIKRKKKKTGIERKKMQTSRRWQAQENGLIELNIGCIYIYRLCFWHWHRILLANCKLAERPARRRGAMCTRNFLRRCVHHVVVLNGNISLTMCKNRYYKSGQV